MKREFRVSQDWLQTQAQQLENARLLDQLIYKWSHSREIVADVLAEKYADVVRAGRKVSAADIERDLQLLLGGSRIG